MTRPLVLVAEDDPKIAALLADYLAAAGFATAITPDGRQVAPQVRALRPAAVLLDLNLVGLDGLDACKAVRQFSQVPILVITARVEELDRLLGLELGADDYVCKPFSPREVVARVRALLRRAAGTPLATSRVVLDEAAWRATFDGVPLTLTGVEFRLLAMLAGHPGRVYSREQLLAGADRAHAEVTDRTIDTHIRNLRRKIGAADRASPPREWIRSVYGVGYAWEDG